jgi:hypothetical protein
VNGLWRRVDKDTDAHTARFQIRDESRQPRRVGAGGPACLTRNLSRYYGYQRALIRPNSANKLDEIRPRIAFDVEFDRRPLAFKRTRDVVDVLRFDMALIGSWMNRDPVNSCAQTNVDCVEHAGLVTAA